MHSRAAFRATHAAARLFAGGGGCRPVSRAGDHVVTEYELVPLFDRTPDGAATGIILFDIYFRGAFFGCQRAWTQARAYIDFLQANDNLFLKASMSLFGTMTLYKNRLASNETDKTNGKPHPTDDSLLIGDNGHTYAATHLPQNGRQFAEAWDILDQLKPDSIPTNVRVWLAGMIAGSPDRVVKERCMSAFDLRD
jgi:hypothetical protein